MFSQASSLYWLFYVFNFRFQRCLQHGRIVHEFAKLSQGQGKVESVAEAFVRYQSVTHMLLRNDFIAGGYRDTLFLTHGKKKSGGTEVVGMVVNVVNS